MKIIDRSEHVKHFEALEGGDIFWYDHSYYVKLSDPVEPEKYNAVNLTCGICCKFDARTFVEYTASRTLEFRQKSDDYC